MSSPTPERSLAKRLKRRRKRLIKRIRHWEDMKKEEQRLIKEYNRAKKKQDIRRQQARDDIMKIRKRSIWDKIFGRGK